MSIITRLNITNNLTVNFLKIKPTLTDINFLYKMLGYNIPMYKHFEDEDEYLLCVSAYVDVRTLCKKNNYEIKTVQTKVIDNRKYNNNYMPYQTVYNKNIIYNLERLNLNYEKI